MISVRKITEQIAILYDENIHTLFKVSLLQAIYVDEKKSLEIKMKKEENAKRCLTSYANIDLIHRIAILKSDEL